MSRIGNMPVEIPAGVDVEIKGTHIRVKGKNGELSHTFPPVISFELDNGILTVTNASDEQFSRAMHGTSRALISNMVTGVSKGFEKILEIHGIGYRAELKGKSLEINVGFSHSVKVDPPEGITFEVLDRNNVIRVSGPDKQIVGQTAANIRIIRKPEPYKGKGIRYRDEYVRRKAGKSGKVA